MIVDLSGTTIFYIRPRLWKAAPVCVVRASKRITNLLRHNYAKLAAKQRSDLKSEAEEGYTADTEMNTPSISKLPLTGLNATCVKDGMLILKSSIWPIFACICSR